MWIFLKWGKRDKWLNLIWSGLWGGGFGGIRERKNLINIYKIILRKFGSMLRRNR